MAMIEYIFPILNGKWTQVSEKPKHRPERRKTHDTQSHPGHPAMSASPTVNFPHENALQGGIQDETILNMFGVQRSNLPDHSVTADVLADMLADRAYCPVEDISPDMRPGPHTANSHKLFNSSPQPPKLSPLQKTDQSPHQVPQPTPPNTPPGPCTADNHQSFTDSLPTLPKPSSLQKTEQIPHQAPQPTREDQLSVPTHVNHSSPPVAVAESVNRNPHEVPPQSSNPFPPTERRNLPVPPRKHASALQGRIPIDTAMVAGVALAGLPPVVWPMLYKNWTQVTKQSNLMPKRPTDRLTNLVQFPLSALDSTMGTTDRQQPLIPTLRTTDPSPNLIVSAAFSPTPTVPGLVVNQASKNNVTYINHEP